MNLNPGPLDSSQWVDRYGDMMYRYTLVRVKNQDAAEEIVQATFVAALQSQKSFAGRSSEKSWLFGILKHKIIDHFRDQKKHRSYDLSSDDDSDPFANIFDETGHLTSPMITWEISPDKAAENKQLVQALGHCLNKLSEKYRSIFVMKEVEGLDSAEICNEFNIQPTNLWVILHRTRNQLKKCLETRWFEK